MDIFISVHLSKINILSWINLIRSLQFEMFVWIRKIVDFFPQMLALNCSRVTEKRFAWTKINTNDEEKARLEWVSIKELMIDKEKSCDTPPKTKNKTQNQECPLFRVCAVRSVHKNFYILCHRFYLHNDTTLYTHKYYLHLL